MLSAMTKRLLYGFFALAIVIAGGGLGYYLIGGGRWSIGDCLYMTVITVTTVGYGDLYPHTVAGRIVGMLVMLLGIGFLSVLTATVASQFVKTDRGDFEIETVALHRVMAEGQKGVVQCLRGLAEYLAVLIAGV